jgi:hypothetical protein
MEWAIPTIRSTGFPWPLLVDAMSWISLGALALIIAAQSHGLDARAYYDASSVNPYRATVGSLGFIYSPVFLAAVQPLRHLPWWAFHLLVVGAGVVALAYLTGNWVAITLIALQMPLIADDLKWGNLYLVTAAVMVVSLRHPAVWAWALLTKVTPGVGALYYLGNRNWRALAIAAISTSGLALGSVVIFPGAWPAWIRTLLVSSQAAPPLLVPPLIRLGIGACIAGYAGMTARAWLIPVSAAVAAPEAGASVVYLLGAWRIASVEPPRGRTWQRIAARMRP